MFRAGAIFLVWLIAIFWIGGAVGKSPAPKNMSASAVANAMSSKQSKTATTNKPDEASSKSDSNKLSEVNIQAVLKGIKKTEGILGIGEWERPVNKARDGVPSLQVYFPQGESMEGWRESFVLRSFVNITTPNPCPVVYETYADWIKTQVPDIKIQTTQDDTGFYFSGTSESGKLYIIGKVYSGAVKETVHIAQYIIKQSPGADEKAATWKTNLSKIK